MAPKLPEMAPQASARRPENLAPGPGGRHAPRSSMPRRPFLTAPPPTAGMPPGIGYIVVNEAAERFSYYGMKAVLVVFMTQYLRAASGALATMSENNAYKWYHLFLGTNYFFPVFGAILADACWGKYRTIFWLSIVYCFGHFALALNDTRLGLAVGLGLIAMGSGGIKPCVSANVGDQFGQSNAHLISRAFGWFYFAINSGSFVAYLLIPYLLLHGGSGLAFLVPGILMLVATVVFYLGRYRFAHIAPRGRAFLADAFNAEGLATLGRLAIIYAFVAVFWSLWDQSGGEWVLQANKMNLHFLGFNWLSSQIQAVNAVLILAFIPLFQFVVYPAIDRIFPLTPLRKIGLGLAVTGLSFVVSAWIEHLLHAGLKPSIAWQMPAYALLTAGEIMVSITALEFSYTQAPKHMKSIVMAAFLLSISAGDFFTALVHIFIQRPDGSLRLEGPAYYLFYSALAVAASGLFAVVAARYREKTHLQDDAPADLEMAAPIS
jgi:proton-dependent oligopeptide transporter, POT family